MRTPAPGFGGVFPEGWKNQEGFTVTERGARGAKEYCRFPICRIPGSN